jgi:C-terminal processing protease CtpA/Prc
MTAEAKTYLDHAIALFQQQHINASKMDWRALTAKAYEAAAGAKTTADTYPAIRLVIKELGEKHTFFLDPDQAKAGSTGKASGSAPAPVLLLPEAVRLADGIGVVRLYGFMGSSEQAERYADTGKAEIKRLERLGVCRFVVDLRFNTGGNMYPMIDAVSGLLHEGVLGTFENAAGKFTPWVLKNGKATTATTSAEMPQATGSPPNALPVAVLVGPSTASAGEYTAMSFKGRANTRFLGAPTAGYITANSPAPLPDGAVIVMTGAWGVDRTGKKYVDAMQPDENTGAGGPAMDAGVKWLFASALRGHGWP